MYNNFKFSIDSVLRGIELFLNSQTWTLNKLRNFSTSVYFDCIPRANTDDPMVPLLLELDSLYRQYEQNLIDFDGVIWSMKNILEAHTVNPQTYTPEEYDD